MNARDMRIAAKLLSLNADGLRESHTLDGEWIDAEAERAEYIVCKDLARQLRALARKTK